MGKLVYLCGKSSTGKDTIYKELLNSDGMSFRRIVPYTTRPIRQGEQNGVEYFFTDEDGFHHLEAQGRVVESRAYNTFHGLWRYFTVDDGRIRMDEADYIMIGTLEAYLNVREYFGAENVLPVLIELDDGVRLQRALDRERRQEHPKYEEMCRRFLADSVDFSEEKVREAGIHRRFYNNDLQKCLDEIREYIAGNTHT